ncbi:hypothetical protein ACFL0T_05270 [Candidatus Omnitrophota bacterium]
MKILRTMLLGVLVLMTMSFSVRAQIREEVTLSTYYPAPFGEYDELIAARFAVGDINGDGQVDNADIIATATDGDLLVSHGLTVGADWINPTYVAMIDGSRISTESSIDRQRGLYVTVTPELNSPPASSNLHYALGIVSSVLNEGGLGNNEDIDLSIGMQIQHGSHSGAHDGSLVRKSYGLRVVPYRMEGRIDDQYDIYVENPELGTGSGSLTNYHYGLYVRHDGPNYFGGNVGIGVTAPQATLDVATGAVLMPRNADNPAAINGSVYYNNTEEEFRFRENGVWKELGGITDESASGYVRIGDLQVCWGPWSHNTQQSWITFPASFLDASYHVSVNSNGYGKWATTSSKTTIKFKVHSFNVGFPINSAGGSYVAIGRWQ